MIAHVIGSLCADNVFNCTVTIKTLFSSASNSMVDRPSKLSSANWLRALAQRTFPA
jgi:hypothetical protein